MAIKRSMASYWNESAWVDITNSDGTSAVTSAELEDIIISPSVLVLKINNSAPSPLDASTASVRDGPFTGVFTDFMPIRLKDSVSNLVYFYGIVYDVKEKWEKGMGMVLELECRDYLTELRDNSTEGGVGYEIDASDDVYAYVSNLAKSNIDVPSNRWSTSVSSRGGLIKSFLAAYGQNISFPTGNSSDDRFVESVAPFEDDGSYRLDGRNQRSVLSHILGLAATDPHQATATTNEQFYGYDFYVDPNVTSTATSHNPNAFFNYFKRGTRPNAAPTTYGLNIELPTKDFTLAGRTQPMHDFEFERPKGEIYTDAVVTYNFVETNADGTTSVVEKKTTFEVLQVQAVSGLSTSGSQVPRWKTLPITSGAKGFNVDDGVLLPEWLQVKLLDSDGTYTTAGSGFTLTTVARMQYINKTSSVSDGAPAYVLISDVDESIDTSAFADDALWYGKDNTSASIKIKSRPRKKYGIRRTLYITAASTSKPDAIRQQVAAALMRRSNQIVRGSFKTFAQPQFYIDDSPASVTTHSGSDQTLDLSGATNPITYGIRIGMPVVKLDANSNPTTTYGYISAITSTTVRLTWNTGTVSASDTVRYYVPVRAGDVIHVKNNLVAVDGIFLVTKLSYTEQPGIFNTHYEVVGNESNAEGGYNKKSFATSIAETAIGASKSEPPPGNADKQAKALHTFVFSSTATNQIDWTSGNLLIEEKTYPIDAGTTASTMIASGDGNTSQSGTTLSAATNYFIYYPGTGTALKTVKAANYRNMVIKEVDPIIIAFCKAAAVKAEYGPYVKGMEPIDFGQLKAGTISTKMTDDMTGVTMNAAGQIFTGTKSYNSAEAGWILEHNGGTPRFEIGETDGNYLQWSGSALAIKGSIVLHGGSSTLSEANTLNANTVGSDLGTGYGDSTIGGWTLASDALYVTNKQTSDGYQSDGFTIASNGSLHSTNFFINSNGSAAFKGTLTVGGTDLDTTNTLNANTTAANVGLSNVQDLNAQSQAQTGLIAGTTITGGGIILSGGGSIHSVDKDNLADDTAGFFLGHDGSSSYDFAIGDGTSYLKWDGSAATLSVKGAITATSGSFVNATGTSGNNKSVTIDSGFIILNNDTATVGSGIRFDGQDSGATTLLQRGYMYYDSSQDRLEIQTTNDAYLFFNGTLPVESDTALVFRSASASVSSKYGIFRYTTDGTVSGADTLGFLTGGAHVSPASDTNNSAFWIMQSIVDGSGSRLILEPNVDWGSGTQNYAYIGYNNPLVSVVSHFHAAGNGTVSAPTHTFYGDTDLGLYRSSANSMAVSAGGTQVATFQSANVSAAVPFTAIDGVYIVNTVTNQYIDNASNGSGSTTLYIGNESITTSSDKRIKKDILTFTGSGLDLTSRLPIKEFAWNDPSDEIGAKNDRGRYLGLIAQDVLDVVPWAINTQGGKDCENCKMGNPCEEHPIPWLLNYDYIVPVLIKAIQELTEKVRKLEGDK